MGKMSELDLIKQDIDLLDKGAIPRITQEIYYTCNIDGSKIVNLDLTLEKFGDTLRRIEPTTVVIDDVGQKYDPTMDNTWVCGYCGSEEVSQSGWVNINTEKLNDFVEDSSFWCDNCNEEISPMTYFDWQEKIAEECMGNKDKYDKIMDGGRA